MNNINIKLGIIDVIWDYDDFNEKRKAFYELTINYNNDVFTFRNNFYFLDNNICTSNDYTETNIFSLKILEENEDGTLKIYLCGDIMYITKEQYKLLNEKITILQSKLKFDINISMKS